MDRAPSPGLPAFSRALVIVNHHAGNHHNRLDGPAALDLLAPLGDFVELALTNGPGHARELAQSWAAAGGDLAVAVGGDGTVHEVAAGLVGSACALSVLPAGSGNDFAGAIGCGTVADARAVVAGGVDVPVDVASLDGEVFVNSCGLLASGMVSGRAAGYWRWLGRWRYTLAAARVLATYRGQDFAWEASGVAQGGGGQDDMLLVEICNSSLTGGGFSFAPDACLTDGLLDVAFVRPLGRWQGLNALPAAARGERLGPEVVSVRQTSVLSFESGESVPYHLDGEAGVLSPGPHQVRVLAQKLIVRMMREL